MHLKKNLFVHRVAEDTPFYGGSFRLKLVFGSDYPSAPPKGYFLTRIFHPNVSSSGDICVNTLKRDWSAELGIGHVLQVIRCLLIVPFPQSSLNEEAGKLFMENYEDYRKHARLMTSIHASSSDVAAPTDASTPAASKSSLAEKKVKTKKAQKKGLKRL